MLAKLALGNVRKSARDYAVYFVTIVLGVAVFYAFNTISDQADFLSGSAGDLLEALGGIMLGLTVFLALVLGFLMVYANNYLVRRRKRELGLYQVLGMRRGQVSAVLALETLVASAASFVAGIVLGVLLSQLLVFVTAALFQSRVDYFTFRFSPYAFFLTLGCFAVMFAVMLLFNLRAIRKVRLVELMESERVNEDIKVRSLPLAVALFLAGAALIAAAYVRLLRDGLPIYGTGNGEGVQFAITTVMVVVGTLLFFYALSGFLLSLVRRAGSVYWSGLNMFTLRQLNAKINTASVSMAVISLILFLAITSVTGGMSICNTMNRMLDQHTPYDASLSVVHFGEEGLNSLPMGADGEPAEGYTVAQEEHDVAAMLVDGGYDLGSIGTYVQSTLRDGSTGDGAEGLDMMRIAQETGVEIPSALRSSIATSGDQTSALDVLSQSDYAAVRAFLGLDPIEMGEDEYLFTTDIGDTMGAFYRGVVDSGYTIEMGGRTLTPCAEGVVGDRSATLMNNPAGTNYGTVVLPDDIASQFAPYMTFLNVDYTVPTEEGDAYFDAMGDPDTSGIFVEDGKTFAYIGTIVTATTNYESSAGMTGIISYMAIYIGFVLVISCAAILAIQQLSAASDAQGSYRLLSELGCPRRLMYRSLLVQTCVYFLFPLAVGLAHSLVALRVVTDVVALFGNLDITTSALMTGGLFVVVYGGYLLVTYRVARGVIRQGMVGARRVE